MTSKFKSGRAWRAAAAIVVSGALVLTGCSTAGSGDSGGSGSAAIIRVNGGEPQNGLVPTNTNEQFGGRIVDALFTGLYAYKADGTSELANAESVETTDNQNYTVKLKKDWKFTDGTPVKAENYVKAWNFGADTENAQLNQTFFAPIEGYDAVAAAKPTVHEMTGLKVVDDYTFTVKLTEPNIDFKLGLGFSPFKPLPDVFFKQGAKEFGEHPIGNGPYKAKDQNAWQHNVRYDAVTNADYKGPDKAKNGGITWIFYPTLDGAYNDLLAGNLDFLDQIPTGALGNFRKDLGDRAVTKPVAWNQTVSIPYYLPHFGGEEGKLRRQALSLAINRDEITKTIFKGLRNPAKDFTARGVPGFSDSIPGNEVLSFNPEKAKQLWAQANAIAPWSGSFQIAYNSDGDHQAWVDAVSNQIKNTLAIDAHGSPIPSFKQVRDQATKGTLTTALRSGWFGDYPSMIEFLAPNYLKGAGANDTRYDNPAFAAKLHEAERAVDVTTSQKITNQSQEILLQDLPVLPLWDYTGAGGLAQGVKGELTWNGLHYLPGITKS